MDMKINHDLVKKLRLERSWSQETLAASVGLCLFLPLLLISLMQAAFPELMRGLENGGFGLVLRFVLSGATCWFALKAWQALDRNDHAGLSSGHTA